MTPISVLYRDDDIIAVDKPAGLLVHRTPLDAHEPRFLLQLLRDQIGMHLHPVHRLDKGTSGVVVFALHAEAARRLADAFLADEVRKTYLAIVRGHAPLLVDVDHPLRDVPDRYSNRRTLRSRPAFTAVQCLARIEIPTAVGRYATARYSLVACRPRSGRRHQIRRHLKHLRHPIVGDANYGDGAHNRFFRDTLGIARLLLAATQIRLRHPFSGADVDVHAPLDGSFRQLLGRPEWQTLVEHDTLLQQCDAPRSNSAPPASRDPAAFQ